VADSTSAASKSWDPKQYQEAIGPAVLAGEPIEIQRLLGSGGEGAAFLCVGRQGQIADQPFVVKIPSDLRDDPSFGLEADLFKDSLKRHCVIPRGPDSLRLKNNAHMHALVMPFCNGGDLKMRMKQRSAAAEPYSFGEAASIMSQTAIGLRESGLVHRDVKPANILFHNEQAMVADWGLAVRPGDRNDPSGTAGYLAPESIRHKFPAHEHQDVYAIGLIGYELVTRRPARPLPPDLVNRLDINKFIDQDDRIRATKKNPLFDQILLHATTRDPDKRSSHLDMLADLAHYPEARRHFNDQDRQAIAAHLIERAAQRPDRSPELDRAAAAGLLEMGPWQERDQRALEAVA
jgi:serine/threonine protein kinase